MTECRCKDNTINEDLRQLIIKHEGWRNKPYKDTVGVLTCGVGRNLDHNGLRDSEIYFMLDNDIKQAIADCKSLIKNWDNINEARQHALIDMVFNLGRTRFSKFKKTIKAIENEMWVEAAINALDSKWATQVKGRAITIAGILRDGK